MGINKINRNGLTITAFTGEVIELDSALISGVTSEHDSPLSLYSGRLDLEEIHNALFYANRAILKVMMDEFGIPLANSEDFLLSAVTEAVTAEYNARVSGNIDVDIKKVVRTNPKSQN